MPKKETSTGDWVISETGNWNVASDFARVKIMIPLSKCEYYEDIAKFGYDAISEELMGQHIQNDYVRFVGLRRLINELLRVCKNTMFAMKVGKTKETLDGYEKRLVKVRNILPLIIKVKRDNISKTKDIILIPDEFEKTLEIVLNLKSLINIPLNKNHLIFTDKEEFDPHAFKESIKERMTSKG